LGPTAGIDGRGKFACNGKGTPDRPAASESLYRLCFPDPRLVLEPEDTSHQWRIQEFCSVAGEGVTTNSVEERGQTERGSGGGSALVRGSTQFATQ
jgi:hypothetical protein